MSESTTRRKVKQIDMREHIKKRSMWAGSKTSQSMEAYILKTEEDSVLGQPVNVFELQQVKYPPALYKLVDEIIVNAIDHYVNFPKLVKEIRITLDEDGCISVYNDGPGIHIEETKNIKGEIMYTPQLIFSEYLAGSNLDDDETKDRIVGGQNGLGAKITAVFSDSFTVETLDSETQTKYTQTFLDGLNVKQPPVLKKSTSKKSYTKITFTPTYKEFKLKIKDFYPTWYSLIEARAWQAAAYTNIKVSFNDKPIKVSSFKDFCSMFVEGEILPLRMNDDKYPWDVCLAITDGKERQLSLINGVYVGSGGTHIKHIQNKLINNLKDKVEKLIKKAGAKFNRNLVLNNIFIFMKGAISNPEFLSQTKDAISNGIEKFSSYDFSTSEWTKIWNFIKPSIETAFLKKQLGNEKQRVHRGMVDVPNYCEAQMCRNAKNALQCGLFTAEGNSAVGPLKSALLNKETGDDFSYTWYGWYSLQGVIVNGLKESIEYGQSNKSSKDKPIKGKIKQTKSKSSSDDDTNDNANEDTVDDNSNDNSNDTIPTEIGKRIPKTKVLENERLSSLLKVLGLDFNKTYDFTDAGEKEFKTLRYGFIIGLTDQDLDGFNIFGLLATFFMTYWPSLIKRGFIRRINTPLIRAYPKNKKTHKVLEFYTEHEYNSWATAFGDENVHKYYTAQYYKGLGSHRPAFKEHIRMFQDIDNKICTYILDEHAIKNMFIFYGEDTNPRKTALSTPVDKESKVALQLPLSQHFEVDTKLYQRDNIIRKLLNAFDGFVECRRKVFYTIRRLEKSREIKVQGLAGETVARANYHHGEASLEQTIVRMAQAFPEARYLPLLQPLGNFGCRSMGYKDFAASRYIYTKLNWRLADRLFRREDDFILPYTLTDGERYEPDHYAPIIPYGLCETNELPATGWTISCYARDIDSVINNTRDLITGKIKECQSLPMNTTDMNGRFTTVNKRLYFVGNYIYDDDTNQVIVTGLPPNKWSYYYINGSDADKVSKKKDAKKSGIKNKDHVDFVMDETDIGGVRIVIQLKPGAIEEISSKYGNSNFDAIEDYFELKAPIYDRINLVDCHGEVVEYKSYEDVFNNWFVYRKELYKVRVIRERILVDLLIQMLKEMQRFSTAHDSYHITKKTTDDEVIKILSKHKYKIFNHRLLEKPKFTVVELLIELITQAKHGANYDYLLEMSYRDLTESAYNKRQKRIDELEERLCYLNDDDGLFIGGRIWLAELDELEKAIKEGQTSMWFYGENEGYEFADDKKHKSKVKTKVRQTKNKV